VKREFPTLNILPTSFLTSSFLTSPISSTSHASKVPLIIDVPTAHRKDPMKRRGIIPVESAKYPLDIPENPRVRHNLLPLTSANPPVGKSKRLV
jgi:hypothetical protein